MFVDFEEDARGETWTDTRIRPMRRTDIHAVAAIHAARQTIDSGRAAEVVSQWNRPSSDRVVLVAEHDSSICGYGKAERLSPCASGGDAPAGWYLTGLVVEPSARRHGVGAALTRGRIAVLQRRAPEVWYFANLRNAATIALHEREGFEFHTQSFSIPGVTFEGGNGALFRLVLTSGVTSLDP